MKMPIALVFAASLFVGVGSTGCNTVNSIVGSAPQKTCAKMTDLCKLDQKQTDECVKQVDELAPSMGKERMEQMVSCVKASNTCAEAGGCMAGTGLSALGDATKSFLKGVGRALQQN